ncbi:MAG: hypothetical protein ACKV2U_08895 [Bryobacteraceae bacterium]
MHIARGFAQRAQLDEAINAIRQTLGPEVVSLGYTLDKDWSGDSAIFFRIVLSDQASRRDQLLEVADRIEHAIVQYLQPLERWDVLPYFNYRSESEQAVLHEKTWA